MYSPRRDNGTSPPPALSNNPFIDHPANAHTRYPDINAVDPTPSSSQFTSWMQPQTSQVNANPTGYFPGGQQSGFVGGYSAPQQSPYPNGGYPQQQGGGYNGGYTSPVQTQPTGLPFQPSSAFGQQLAGQLGGTYGPQPTPQQQYSGYPTNSQYGSSFGYQQPQQQNQYLAEFDPYSQQQNVMTSQPSQNGSQYKAPHPREYVRDHKTELEAWDGYHWKQTLNAFDALKESWQKRKLEAEARANAVTGLFSGYGGGNYGQAQEYARLEQVVKQADSNIDSVVAARFQMEEAHAGYRQSGDVASKKRVRESINAALSNLPDWPQPAY